MSYIVNTTHLTKQFEGKEVVSNVNMKVKQGQIYGFLGPNGAGKTTIMRMLLNLVKPSSGEITLFGQKLTPTSYEVFKRIGSIIEYPVFYDKLTARENLELHCQYMGLHNRKAIDEALELVQLTNVDGKAVSHFSLGMKQRLGIARAIATKPELLILDEPINGLDPVGIKELRGLFSLLSKQYGMTLLISSHILGEIEQIADTIGVISGGRLIEECAMNDLRGRHTVYVELVTTNIKKAAYVLEHILELSNFRIINDSMIRIYETDLSQAEVSKTLIMNDIEIESINKRHTTLEEYFLQLIEGGQAHA
ncbi:ABC transporter ATP-binding protein [Paenibacillus oenotherae]|uniref:ABC transporter ATP-binding protein n=1 Tax=Paenibacillus oenotherae TaxID=1435645 RepID=A0ABS7D942_9BACL|nr:ABC transporter ATP-binding protein [Paenibacillus oenotherae]MBW7476386.1 ABC transporter ATP-binding protein [Paenibacillus oenotherae]